MVVGRTKEGCSLASHTLCREEGSGLAGTIELSPQQKFDVTNHICTLRRSHLLSWSTITLQHLTDNCSLGQ